MTTTLCFDFGNTRLKCAIFFGDKLHEVVVLENDSPETIEKLLQQHYPERTILSSVINHPPEVEALLAKETAFYHTGWKA